LRKSNFGACGTKASGIIHLRLKKVRGQEKRPGGKLLGVPSAEQAQQQQDKEPKRREQGQQPSLFDEREPEES